MCDWQVAYPCSWNSHNNWLTPENLTYRGHYLTPWLSYKQVRLLESGGGAKFVIVSKSVTKLPEAELRNTESRCEYVFLQELLKSSLILTIFYLYFSGFSFLLRAQWGPWESLRLTGSLSNDYNTEIVHNKWSGKLQFLLEWHGAGTRHWHAAPLVSVAFTRDLFVKQKSHKSFGFT